MSSAMPLPAMSGEVPPSGASSGAPLPLVVEFDRAVLLTDPLHERLLTVLKQRPWAVPGLVFRSGGGRPAFEAALRHEADVASEFKLYPLRPGVGEFIAQARRDGRDIVWLSGEDLGAVSDGGGFGPLLGDAPDVIRPEATPEALARTLAERYPAGFAYLGRSDTHLPVWRAARERFGTALSPSLRGRASAEALGIAELGQRAPLLPAIIRSVRPHQWLKNLLLFVPFVLDVKQLQGRDLVVALVAFACLCGLTSGTYLLNDLSDADADRRHPRKRKRPIASGALPIAAAVPIALGLIAASLAVAGLIRFAFAAALGAYLVITLAYSFRLKRMAMVDVLVIAMLFTLRILAGMLLVGDKPSHWLLMFSIFFFLSLAFMKREVEFNVMRQAGRTTLSGRGYDLDDRLYVLCCGLSSGIASVVIFALFITATIERAPLNYNAPNLLWGVMGVLGYWVLRMWMLTTRGLMNDDPILFAARDRSSLVLGLACALLAVGAQTLRF